jgi:flavodoxin
MKPLVVFYSRTGTTKKVAAVISDYLNGTLKEIVDTVDRSGISGYAAAREDAVWKKKIK